MTNPLSKDFNYKSLLMFALPTAIMMVVVSLYTIVDGIFIARYVGSNALASINIVSPFYSAILAIGVMLGTGGSAIIAKRMGEGVIEKARKNFSMIVLTGFIAGVVISVVGLVFLDPLIYLLGSSDLLFGYCKDYLQILLVFMPAFILQVMFQTLFVTAGKPKLGLTLIVGAGVLNIILDYVFIVVMELGVAGAALGTSVGFMLPAVVGVGYFLTKRNNLHFTKPDADWRALSKTCTNGSSEMVTNLANGIMVFLFNYQMMKYVGEDGVAAITTVLYAQFIFTAIYFGFSTGVAPILSYNYGSGNTERLRKVFKMSITTIVILSVSAFVLTMILAPTITNIFLQEGTYAHDLAISGFYIFAVEFLFCGVNVYASAFFTALSNGKVSAFISLMRTFVFIAIAVLVLPIYMGLDGVWIAVPLAEFLTIWISIYLIKSSGYTRAPKTQTVSS